MKPIRTTIALLASFTAFNHYALAQGPLAPTSGPATTMKTLQQIEPRTDLAKVDGVFLASMHRITEPGSYYLSGNIDVTAFHGIEIAASGVTLDLNGFSLFRSSTDASAGAAILINTKNLSNIVIKNGHITSGVTFRSTIDGDQFTGSGFDSGIREDTVFSPDNVRVSHVHISGCNIDGINLGPSVSNTIEYCSVEVAGSVGIRAGGVHHSTAINCGSTGIFATGNVSHCYATSSGSNGILSGGNVSNCYGITSSTSTGADGIFASYNISNSFGRSSGGNGLKSGGSVSNSSGISTSTSLSVDGISAATVLNSYGTSSGDDGISSTGNVSNSYGISTSTSKGDGISAIVVLDSYGISSGDYGISASRVTNSYGRSTGGDGIVAYAVSNSHGISDNADGIEATTVFNSYGSGGDDGIDADRSISYSRGSGGRGYGIRTENAIGCTAIGGVFAVSTYLMP